MLWERTKSFKETCRLLLYGTMELPALMTETAAFSGSF